MILAGKTTLWCDYPIGFDSYKGCGFGCSYCYSHNRNIIPAPLTRVSEVINFILGKRNKTTNWCNWQIPLRWGVMSDPFQSCELKYKRSYQILKEFADRFYPFIVCTKSDILAKPEYLDLISNCNCVLQVSLCSPRYAIYEHSPSFEDRLRMISKLAKVLKRVIVRIQPYIPHIKDDVISQIPVYRDIGVYGITIEGYCVSGSNRAFEGMEALPNRLGPTRYVYDSNWLACHFSQIKDVCHAYGMAFLSAQDDLRDMGDYKDCCIGEPIKDFEGNKFNVNYKPIAFPDIMQEPYTGYVFSHLSRDYDFRQICKTSSYKDVIEVVLYM